MDLFAITDFNRFQKQLESIHDGVHVNVGGSMAVVNYAAFDPIFHLHHTNVDRLMAMYQNIQPGNTMTPGPRSNTLALGGGPAVSDTPTTPLYPFRHPGGNEWTPDELKSYTSIFDLGYSYPEVPQPNKDLPTRDTISIGNLNRNYTVTQANQLYAPDDAASQTRTEYSAVVVLDTAEFTESCRVLLYLSPSPGVQDTIGLAPVFVGETIAKQSITRVNATIPLTGALNERGHGSLESGDVVPLLKDQLFWSIEKVESSDEIPLENIKSLQVAVYSREGSYAMDQVPTKGQSTVYSEVTEGKQGGWKTGDPPIVGAPVPDESTVS
ncbi:MAG: hypothetical protein M1840_002760 [Geoglossum simile]|nr:MAG: hypothetical protein M1840_002760 [Geoglossum simile]